MFPATEQGSDDPSQSHPATNPGMFQRPRLLLVDSDEEYLATLESVARKRCLVRSATDVKDALKAVRTFTPDLVISDVDFEKTSGTEFLEELRCDSRTQVLPFVFLTNNSERNVVNQSVAFRVSNYILKGDFEPNDLLMTIAVTLNRMDMLTEE